MLKLTTNRVNIFSLVLTAFTVTVLLAGCSPAPVERSGVSRGGCPAGLYKEIDSDECETLLDALDLDEDDHDFKKKKAKVKPLAKQPTKSVVSPAKPKTTIKTVTPAKPRSNTTVVKPVTKPTTKFKSSSSSRSSSGKRR